MVTPCAGGLGSRSVPHSEELWPTQLVQLTIMRGCVRVLTSASRCPGRSAGSLGELCMAHRATQLARHMLSLRPPLSDCCALRLELILDRSHAVVYSVGLSAAKLLRPHLVWDVSSAARGAAGAELGCFESSG